MSVLRSFCADACAISARANFRVVLLSALATFEADNGAFSLCTFVVAYICSGFLLPTLPPLRLKC